jgi:hypothetical protein
MHEVMNYILILLFITVTVVQILGLIYIYLGKFKSKLALVVTHVALTKVEPARLVKVKAYVTMEVLINITLYVLFFVGNADIRFFTVILFYAVPYVFKKLFERLLTKNSES